MAMDPVPCPVHGCDRHGCRPIVVRHAGPLAGEVVVPGAKNSVLKLMAATLLADGVYRADQRARRSSTSSIMGDLLAAIGVADRRARPRPARSDHQPRRPHAGRAVRAGRADPGVDQRARPAAHAAAGTCALSLPGGDDFGARPIDMHVAGSRGDGRHVQVQPRLPRGVRRPPARRRHHVRLPERRRDREPADRGGATPKGTTVDRQRGARAGDRRPVRLPGRRWAPTSRASASSTLRDHGVEPGSLHAADHARRSPTASRPRPTSPRSPSPAASSCCAAPGPTHMEMLLTPASPTWASTIDVVRRRPARSSAPERLRSIDVATLPYPGHRHRLQAADHHDAVGRRRRRHRHREPLPGPLPLRRGAAAARRRHPHRRPPRRRARRRAGCRARRCVRTTSAPARRWWWPAWPPRATTTITGVHHIDRGYDDLVGRLARVGADIERVVERRACIGVDGRGSCRSARRVASVRRASTGAWRAPAGR